MSAFIQLPDGQNPSKGILLRKSKKEVPYRIQLWSQVLSIPFGIASVILAVYAIYLGKVSKDHEQQMNELRDIANELKIANRNQGKEIEHLSSVVEGVHNLQKLYFEQNRTAQVNTEPSVKMTGDFAYQEFNGKILHLSGVINDGQRDALALQGSVTSLYYMKDSSLVIYETPIYPEDLKAHQSVTFVDTLNIDKEMLITTSKYLVFRYEFHYIDPLTQKPKFSYEYYTHTVDGLKVKTSPTITPEAKRYVDKAIARSRAIRKK